VTDLFEESHSIWIPEKRAIEGRLHGADIFQVEHAGADVTLTLAAFKQRQLIGQMGKSEDDKRRLFLDRKTAAMLEADEVYQVGDASSIEAVRRSAESGSIKRMSPSPLNPAAIDLATAAQMQNDARTVWSDKFELRQEVRDEQGAIVSPGLRTPQVGALHAALSHWTVSNKPATIIMPTGTGKTTAMMAIMTAAGVHRLMVVAPTDALRTQIADNFAGLEDLKLGQCLPHYAPLPIVARLNKIPMDLEEVDDIFLRANVIVTTMNVASGASADIQARMASHVSHLFIDEAHHVPAKTWRRFRAQFLEKNVLQFTATPFREDRARVDGRPIYAYPLWKAQADGYFKKVRYLPVNGVDQDDSDQRIIAALGEMLQADIDTGFPHVAMVRGYPKVRAEALHTAYTAAYPQWRPLFIHSGLSSTEKKEIIAKLRSHESRIIVCVDMLKEGFDLPELKIAALHDKQKSEATTLQFVGRFTRVRADLGDATIIANLALGDVNESLRKLYAEDADWNKMLNVIGGQRTEAEIRREELFQNFPTTPERFPLETLFPRMSTVVYKTRCDEWEPYKIEGEDKNGAIVEGPHVNDADRLVVYVQRDFDQPKWTTVREFQNREYNLFLLHWDPESGLLYIHSSQLKELHEQLAKLVCGEDVERITGEAVFRAMHGFKRLLLNNLGLSETQRRPVRHSNFMGVDITPQVDTLPGNQNRIKTNLFGQGYTDEGKSTIGCSRKGKFWSYEKTNNFAEWIDWCHTLGAKLTDQSIPTDAFLRNLIKPRKITERPNKTPIAIMWPEGILDMVEDRIEIQIGENVIPIFDCDIELTSFETTGPIMFRVGSDESYVQVEMTIGANGAEYRLGGRQTVHVKIGNRGYALSEWFKEDPPHIYFGDGDMLLDNELFPLPEPSDQTPYDLNKIEPWDWTGTNIRKESQGVEKVPDAIQRRVIDERIAEGGFDVIYDDDGSGEVADVIAMKKDGRRLSVELIHCKYSSEDLSGARVGDLYEVLGQAQKSTRWREYPKIFFQRLRSSEARRLRRNQPSRYELGDASIVNGWFAEWNETIYEFSVTIVQPGYSKSGANPDHLRLVSATEAFLMETWGMPLKLITSA
tara:strand:+ start:1058 stop:4360 length:3303 start_codon:yes stop_codon:yes gene_type:complete